MDAELVDAIFDLYHATVKKSKEFFDEVHIGGNRDLDDDSMGTMRLMGEVGDVDWLVTDCLTLANVLKTKVGDEFPGVPPRSDDMQKHGLRVSHLQHPDTLVTEDVKKLIHLYFEAIKLDLDKNTKSTRSARSDAWDNVE